jgi:histidine triad (HIT) family protein
MPADCPFCAIVADEAPASVVHETDELLAFLDINPINEGHTLVVPTAHYEGLAGLPAGTGGRLFQLGQEIAGALRSARVPTDGINLFLADSAVAGQEVFHVHLHVIPRTDTDDMYLNLPRASPDREELDGLAADTASEL